MTASMVSAIAKCTVLHILPKSISSYSSYTGPPARFQQLLSHVGCAQGCWRVRRPSQRSSTNNAATT